MIYFRFGNLAIQVSLPFNQTNYESTVYGHLYASDLQVRKAALLAYALPYIESQIEDLVKLNALERCTSTFIATFQTFNKSILGSPSLT